MIQNKKATSYTLVALSFLTLDVYKRQAESGEPVSGGTVNIPITDDPTTLQGWMLRNSNESVLAPAIYETLLQYDETGKPVSYTHLDVYKRQP